MFHCSFIQTFNVRISNTCFFQIVISGRLWCRVWRDVMSVVIAIATVSRSRCICWSSDWQQHVLFYFLSCSLDAAVSWKKPARCTFKLNSRRLKLKGKYQWLLLISYICENGYLQGHVISFVGVVVAMVTTVVIVTYSFFFFHECSFDHRSLFHWNRDLIIELYRCISRMAPTIHNKLH